MEFENGIELRDWDGGLLVRQFGDAYLARKWRLTPQTIQLVRTAIASGLRWMIREGHPQAHARWPSGKGRVYLAFSPTRENQWSMAIDRFSERSGHFGAAVFNGKYHSQFVQHEVGFEFEKRNRRSGHMVVAQADVLPTLRLLRRLDHQVLYLHRTDMAVEGFATEYDIQRALLFDWDSTVFAERYSVVTDEFPVDLGQNPRRIDILCEDRDSGGLLVLEIKRAEADLHAVNQIEEYVGALRRREDFVGIAVAGALVAERVPRAVREEANRSGIAAYEVSYPLGLERVT